jgi:hypothetical protein
MLLKKEIHASAVAWVMAGHAFIENIRGYVNGIPAHSVFCEEPMTVCMAYHGTYSVAGRN